MNNNLSEKIKRVKDGIYPLEKDIFLVSALVLTALIAFGLGRLSVLAERKIPVKVDNFSAAAVQPTSGVGDSPTPDVGAIDKLYVASKNGTKYHYPWCSGAQTIKEENKIWFGSKEEAKAAGYTPASNCKGL